MHRIPTSQDGTASATALALPLGGRRPATCPARRLRAGTRSSPSTRTMRVTGGGRSAPCPAARAAGGRGRRRRSRQTREQSCENDPRRGLRGAQLHAHATRGLVPNDPGFHLQWNLQGPLRHQHARRLGSGHARKGARRPRRDRGGARHRRGLPALPPLPPRARPQPLRARLRLRGRRQPPQRPERPRHPRGGHDRPEHRQRHRRRRHRLPGEDHAGTGARRRRRRATPSRSRAASATRPAARPG